jgi:sporulation protein YlmC with PRC-barrel domain
MPAEAGDAGAPSTWLSSTGEALNPGDAPGTAIPRLLFLPASSHSQEFAMPSDATYVGGRPVDVDETNRLISSDKVEGTDVYNRNGDHLGSVRDLMIDKRSGQVEYAIMSFGGFLGMGESYHPLPWRMLTYDTGMGGYVVDVDRDRLDRAPRYTSTAMPR